MRRGSLVAPVIVILIGVLFLMNNLRPELPLIAIISEYWPFLLVAWGAMRLIEILFWAARGRPLPASGISGGEWVVIIFIVLFGSGSFLATHRDRWPGFNVRLRGLEMLGDVYDYPVPDQRVAATEGKTLRVVVESFRGNARITGADVREVRLTGRKTVRAMDRADADRASDSFSWELVREGETVFVRPGGIQPGTASDLLITTDLDITIPADARVEARGRRGDFDITDVRGDVDIDSDNSGVRLQNIGGNVRVELRASDIVRAIGIRGDVDIKGSGHDLELEDIQGQLTVTGNYVGELEFRAIARPVRFEGGLKNRATELRLEACPGQIRMDRGSLSLENVAGPIVVRAGSKDVQIAGFSNALDVKLERGDMEIRAEYINLPRVSAVTNSGNIELTLPENARFSFKGSVDKGEIENDFGDVLDLREANHGATLTGVVGGGTELMVHTNRGVLRVRKGGSAEMAEPVPPVRKLPARAAEAAKATVVERN